MKKFLLLFIITQLVLLSNSLAKDDKQRYTLRTGSYAKHILDDGDDDYNQDFENKFFALGIGVYEESEILIGSLKNSFDNRCLFLGYGTNWHNFNKKLSFEGIYAYVGEFFIEEFKDCGDEGFYRKSNERFNVGFAPYIYHGLKYQITPYFAVESGIVLPDIAIASVIWSF